MSDAVKHPSHYTQGGIECIEAIKASMTHEAYCGYLKGNAIKYLWRYQQKGGVEDLDKAGVYLDWLRKEVATEPCKTPVETKDCECYGDCDHYLEIEDFNLEPKGICGKDGTIVKCEGRPEKCMRRGDPK